MGTKSKNICDDALEKEYKLTDLEKQPRKIEATHAAYEINNVSSLTHGIHQLDVDVNAVQGGKYSKRNQRRLMRQPPQSHTPYQPLHGSHHHHIKIIHHTNHHLTEHAWDAETSTANGMLNARPRDSRLESLHLTPAGASGLDHSRQRRTGRKSRKHFMLSDC